MTPKEKAIELVGKYCLNDCTDKNIKKCKKYALIGVDEILKSYKYKEVFETYDTYKFYKKVKQEIEKL